MSSATSQKTLFRRLTAVAAMLLCAAGGISSPAFAEDVLSRPSLQSPLVTSRLLIDVHRAGERLVGVGQRGHIIYSDDKGKTWEQAAVPVSVLLTAVDFADADNGWAVGHSGVILHSSDGGKTWAKQFDGEDANKLVISEMEAKVAELEEQFAALEDPDGDMASADLEAELEEATFTLEDARFDAELGPTKPLLDVWFEDSTKGFAVGSYGFFFRTDDGGKSWQNYSANIDNLDRFHLNVIEQIEGGALIIAGEGGIVFRSLDAGETWESLESPYEGSFFGISGTGKPEEILLLGLRGNLFLSPDKGDSWELVPSKTDLTLTGGSALDSGLVVLVGTSGIMLFSSDYGRTFTPRVRDDRLSLTSVLIVNKDKVLITGESGVSIMNGVSKI